MVVLLPEMLISIQLNASLPLTSLFVRWRAEGDAGATECCYNSQLGTKPGSDLCCCLFVSKQ